VKPFRVKSNTQLKGSDKKKLKAQIKAAIPKFTDDDLNTLLPTKEEIISSKVYTFGGDNVILYIYKRDTVFFQIEKENQFFPTVYTLWKFPKVLPVLTTQVPVMSRLLNGADLMLPGVIVDDSKCIKGFCDGLLEKGDAVAINLSNNLAPIAVGKSFRSSEDMYMACKRGKGVEVLHCYGDQEYSEDQDEEEEGEAAEGAKDNVAAENESTNEIETKLDAVEIKEEELAQEVDPRSDAEVMDELLRNAFLQAWKTSAKKIEFPILTALFFRQHMMHCAPPGVNLDIKKSSYKKLSKFLAEQVKAGIIQIKELQKGVDSIMSVNLEHDDIKHFRVVKYQQVEEPMVEETVLPCDKDYEPPKIVELRTVNSNVMKLFSCLGIAKGEGLTGSQVQKLLVRYVKENELQDLNNKAQVKLDPVLAGLVLGKGENDVLTMKWDELNQRVNSKMSEGYSLEFAGYKPQIFKGKLEPIDMKTATRSGNKKVTLITNLETYGIDPNRFAHKCQVGVASSTSVKPAVNKKSGYEVLVQGNQITFATKLLIEEFKIPRKYIQGIENAPKKKKK